MKKKNPTWLPIASAASVAFLFLAVSLIAPFPWRFLPLFFCYIFVALTAGLIMEVFLEKREKKEPLPCPHGRFPMGGEDGWKHCPHCLGINR